MTRLGLPHTPPESVCVLRLSALGDACHTLALVEALRRAWPATRFTWIIGRFEHRLLSLAPGIEFITLDKRAGWREATRLARLLSPRRFDLLLHLQLALRASLVSALVPARVRLGFDVARARELQWLFTNARIAPQAREHVLDGLMGFARALGVSSPPSWHLAWPAAAAARAHSLIPPGREVLLISPCSSHPLRNWRPERYAAVAQHATRAHGLAVLLVGGPSRIEREMADAIQRAASSPVTDLVGRDTLPELLALLARARALLTPDSGPAHMAAMVGLPVLGLYAATNPARSGPYFSREWCVDRYDAAARKFRGRPAAQLPWTAKIEAPGVMDLIGVDAVCERLDALLRGTTREPGTGSPGC